MDGSLMARRSRGWIIQRVKMPFFLRMPYPNCDSLAAMSDFWRAKDQWLPTWGNKVEDKSFLVYVFFSSFSSAVSVASNVNCY